MVGTYEFLCFHFDLCIAQMTFGRSVIERLRRLEDFHDTSEVTYKFGKSRLNRAELLLQRFHIVMLYYNLQCIEQNTFVFGSTQQKDL